MIAVIVIGTCTAIVFVLLAIAMYYVDRGLTGRKR